MNPSQCPICGYNVDAATELHHEPISPKPGDFSLCLNCGSLNKFGDDLGLVESTEDDILLLAADQFVEVRKAQDYIRKRGVFA